MIKLAYPVIVEGKYDKITLGNFIDTLIIPTNGFSIFKDAEKCKMISNLCDKCGGIIILTDSDSAGNVIRAHLKNVIQQKDKIINVYIPQIKGKERRKDTPSKSGYLGVEAMNEAVILEALKKSGVTETNIKSGRKITKADLFAFGLSGTDNSTLARISLLKFLSLPENLSSNAFLDILNTYFSYDEFKEEIHKWQSNQDKS